MSACGGGGGDGDPTERPINNADLAIMAVYDPDLPQEFAGFVRTADSGIKTNEQAAQMAPDPEEEALDQEQFGQLGEYVRKYAPPGGGTPATDERAFRLVSTVQLFPDAAGASGYLADEATDLEGSIGKQSEGGTIQQVKRFKPPKIGDESVGLRMTLAVGEGDQERPAYGTQVSFRYGRLLLSVTLVRTDDTDIGREVETLARSLEERLKVMFEAQPEITPTSSGTSPTPSGTTPTPSG